jgi:hypothetical protein
VIATQSVVTQLHMSQPAHDLSGGVWPMAADRSGLGLSAPEHRNAATSAVVHNRSSRAHGPPPPALPASATHQIAPSSPQPVPSPRFQLRGGGSRRLIRAAAADLDRLQLLGCNQPVHAASAQPEHVGRLGGDHWRFRDRVPFLPGPVTPPTRIEHHCSSVGGRNVVSRCTNRKQ